MVRGRLEHAALPRRAPDERAGDAYPPGPDRGLDALLRASLAAWRSDRGSHGRRADRPEEPRVRRDRRDPAAERAVRGRGRRDPLRDLRHQPTDLDRARAPGWRPSPPARCSPPASPTSRTSRRSWRGITLASGVLFLVLAVLKMGWIAQFLSRAVVTGFLFGAAIDVVIGELPKITGTEVERLQLAPGALVVARDAGRDAPGDAWSWASSRSSSSSGCASSRPGCPVPWSWWSAGCSLPGCSTSGTVAWRWSATCPEDCRRSRSPTAS